jgi:hypothetical protein
MNVFIANFGRGNWAWPECLKRQSLAVMDDVRLHVFWQSGDKDGYIREAQKLVKPYGGGLLNKAVASRWFGLNDVFKDTVNDLWIHREKEVIWWAVSNDLPQIFETIEDPNPISKPARIHVYYKPCSKWSDKDKLGRRLSWSGLHPKARDFLFTEATCQKLKESNAGYAQALINGDNLESWHSQSEWKMKVEKSKKQPATQLDAKHKTIIRMVMTAIDTVKASGGTSLVLSKDKQFHFSNQFECEKYIKILVDQQEGICALTGILMILDGNDGDNEFAYSLDRIDSSLHYEPGNLQIVCKFANRWKGASNNDNFLRLIECVQKLVF